MCVYSSRVQVCLCREDSFFFLLAPVGLLACASNFAIDFYRTFCVCLHVVHTVCGVPHRVHYVLMNPRMCVCVGLQVNPTIFVEKMVSHFNWIWCRQCDAPPPPFRRTDKQPNAQSECALCSRTRYDCPRARMPINVVRIGSHHSFLSRPMCVSYVV